MVDPDPPYMTQLVAEALGTVAIPGKISVILAGRFRTVCEGGTALTPDKRSGWGIQSFLAQLASGVDHIPGLDWVYLIGVDHKGTVHLLHLILYVLVDLYYTRR